MGPYDDVPEWLRITGNRKHHKGSNSDNFSDYYKAHFSELTQEMREIEKLEAEGEIVCDAFTRVHDRYRASRKSLAAKSAKHCPSCGSELNEWNLLRDRGPQYGIECDDCR